MSQAVKDIPALVKLLRLAYSAERAASFAYQGHAASVKSAEEKRCIKQIEDDEWHHRSMLLAIMEEQGVSVSKWYEWKYWMIGKIIGASCFVIGWFMPNYFAGRLESGNVNEYILMQALFNEIGITEYDQRMQDFAAKEKEHELYFLGVIQDHWLLPLFSTIFGWGLSKSFNPLP